MTKNIADMNGSELRHYLGIESVSDRSREAFDRWDNKHPHTDYREADDRRRDLIKKFTDFAFVGPDEDEDDPEDIAIFSAIKTDDDRKAIAKELVNCNTYSGIDVDVTFPEDYDGLDGYVYAAQVEFFYNLSGEYADREEILACFQDDYEPF